MSTEDEKLSIHLHGIMQRVLEELASKGLLDSDEMVSQEEPATAMMFSFLYLYQFYAEKTPCALPPPYDVMNSFVPTDPNTGNPEPTDSSKLH